MFFRVSIYSLLVCALSTDYSTLNRFGNITLSKVLFADEKYLSICEINSEEKPLVNVTCKFSFRVENFTVKEKLSKVQFSINFDNYTIN